MDQKCVSGLGNIYVNEILFVSGIKPVRQVNKLKDFSTDEGKKGKFQQFFKIYGREGKKCSNTDCNKKVVRIIVSNRSTFFCKRCQK